MKTLILATALLMPAAAMAQSVTITGHNGGTIQKDRSCARGDGTASCEVATTRTGPGGATATKLRSRTTTAGASDTTITRTGPRGTIRTRSRTVRW
ncbi:hypothetical protein FHY55_08535 [Oceanicola sp. D3]|uniref:hypothetical protein n=1 Tax=Oceanicola sp. D3 TaxID=2587163 RepID=UPI00111DA19C|nr:hypothetical protein [Oceanicola sp. D3]QDC09284.1 hypothetical protein FHY55_08535 [Oceanicola sp. D3]